MVEESELASVSQIPEEAKCYGYGIFHGLKVRIKRSIKEIEISKDDSDNDLVIATEDSVARFKDMFDALGVRIETSEIAAWLNSDVNDSGVQIFTDDEICDMVSQPATEEAEEDEEEESEDPCPVSHSDAARVFEWGLTWLERQPEATISNTTVLRELHAMAMKKKMQSIKQTKLCQYFQ